MTENPEKCGYCDFWKKKESSALCEDCEGLKDDKWYPGLKSCTGEVPGRKEQK